MKKNESKRRRGGFTLIEVMLVVVILGILATVVVVQFRGHGVKARISATRTSIKNICTAIDMYELAAGRLPGSLKDLTMPLGDDPPLIRGGAPTDAWGVEFGYSAKGDLSYEVRSAGPDAQMNTGDDITN